MNRRKLALHVNPSPLAYETPVDVTNPVDCEDVLAVNTDEEVLATADAGMLVAPEITHEAIKLTEQPPIIDTLVGTSSNETENVLPNIEISLPEVSLYND
jgi:hypothetical protein